MTLIDSIQIKYLRSIHSLTLKDLFPLVVLAGANDVGKSNILKALNLFFNGNVDWQTQLDFQRDFSKKRLVEVQRDSIKGKQYIQITARFNRPETYGGSLPEKFSITRTWDRTGFMKQTDSLKTEAKRLNWDDKKLKTAERFLSIYLGRVRFSYIPAIKDRLFFNHILGNLQDTLLSKAKTGQTLKGDCPTLC